MCGGDIISDGKYRPMEVAKGKNNVVWLNIRNQFVKKQQVCLASLPENAEPDFVRDRLRTSRLLLQPRPLSRLLCRLSCHGDCGSIMFRSVWKNWQSRNLQHVSTSNNLFYQDDCEDKQQHLTELLKLYYNFFPCRKMFTDIKKN